MSSFFQKIPRSILNKIVYEALLSNAVLKNPERKNVRHKLGALSNNMFSLPLFLDSNVATINKLNMPSCSPWKSTSFNSVSNFWYVWAPLRRVKPFLKPDEHFWRNFSATEKTWWGNILISFFVIHFYPIWREMITLACWRIEIDLYSNLFSKCDWWDKGRLCQCIPSRNITCVHHDFIQTSFTGRSIKEHTWK